MVIASLIALAVLLAVVGVRRFGADSRDGRDWHRSTSDNLSESHPWTAGYRAGQVHDTPAHQEIPVSARERGLFG
jgi:hypothetical protein